MIAPGPDTSLTVGADAQQNLHTLRSSANQLVSPYQNTPRRRDAAFDQAGVFAESTHELSDDQRLIGGARIDWWRAEKTNLTTSRTFERDAGLPAGFARYEHDFGCNTLYAGLGHAARFPDYWEIIGGQPAKPDATFLGIDPEKTTQLDIGVTRSSGPIRASLALFASHIDDYILLQPALAARTRNIDARTHGGEAALEYSLTDHWLVTASLAAVHGTNRTDDRALAQMPPLESRLGLSYAAPSWTVGGLVRLVSAQDRIAPGQGNIVGQDLLTPSDGFAVLSLNAGWQFHPQARLTAGVDNLLDTTYAEHISRSGAAVAGYPVTTRVNEPGLNLWMKLEVSY